MDDFDREMAILRNERQSLEKTVWIDKASDGSFVISLIYSDGTGKTMVRNIPLDADVAQLAEIMSGGYSFVSA